MTDEKPHDDSQQIRNGPKPLGLHVSSAMQNWAGAAAAFPLFHLGGLQIHPDLKPDADDLLRDMAPYDLEKLQIIIMQKAQARLAGTLAGITRYQQHPFQRRVTPAALFDKIGTTEIRDYGPAVKKDAPIALVVPSLVNPAYILDLAEDHSFMRRLAARNIHPYLIDWANPAAEEKAFGLEDYILQRLIPAIHKIRQHHPARKIHLIGYCMGGNLSLAAAQILQSENVIKSLTLIATPWDFHAGQPAHMSNLLDYFLKTIVSGQNARAIPMDILQLFFFSLDPTLSDRKFRKFRKFSGPKAEDMRHFIAIEDWANDGAPLAMRVAHDCLFKWYQKNQTQNDCWQIGDHVIDPGKLILPGHIITPKADRIVPVASAMALQEKLPHFTHTSEKGGHVTMIAGRKSSAILWDKIAYYLK